MGENDIWLRFCEWFKNAPPEAQRGVRKFFLTMQMSQVVWRLKEFHTGHGRGKLTKDQVKQLKREFAGMLTPSRKPGRPKGATNKKGLGQKGDRRKPYVDLWLKEVRKPEYYRELLGPEMSPEEFKVYFEDNICRTFRRWDRQAAIALEKANKKRRHPPLFMPKRRPSGQQPPTFVN